MWVFTVHGAFYASNARVEDKYDAAPDPDRVAIRVRDRQHLVNLQEKFDELNVYSIYTDKRADYPHRMFVPKEVWVRVLTQLASEMNYDRFKPSVVHFPGYGDYKQLLLKVWQTVFDHSR